MNPELEIVLGIARKAGAILMEYFNKEKAFNVEQKDSRAFNFVTEADREADAFIRSELAKAFPEDRILSEESADVPADYHGRIWIVDPLDDTKGFVNGNDGFAVMIGLCLEGAPQLGVVFAPARPQVLFGAQGQGAYEETLAGRTQLHASGIGDLSEARFVTRFTFGNPRSSDGFVENMPVKAFVPEGSVGLKWGLIAGGKAEFYFTTHFLEKWDTCAPQAILEAAGGTVTDVDGAPLDYLQTGSKWQSSIVASNGIIHSAALDIARRAPALSSDG